MNEMRHSSKERPYDVVIAGAGPAGTVAARNLAEYGYRVLICDMRPRDHIGGNPAVFDGVREEDWQRADVAPAKGKERGWVGETNAFYSPDRKSVKLIPMGEKWYSTNRRLLGQRLLGEAETAGALFAPRQRAIGLIVEDGEVQGLKLRPKGAANKKKGEEQKSGARTEGMETVYGRVVVDATGYARGARRGTRLQRSLPAGNELVTDLSLHDTCLVYREMRTGLETPLTLQETYFEAHGNLSWAEPYPFPYPRTDRSVMITAVTLDGTDPRTQLAALIEEYPAYAGERVIATQYGEIPFGRCVHSFASDRFVAVGDAAYQLNPINGCGIGAAMYAASLAATAIHEALFPADERGATKERLWPYTVKYQRTLGARFAALDGFRRFATVLSAAETDLLFHADIINAERINSSHARGKMALPPPTELFAIAPRLVGHTDLALKLAFAQNLIFRYRDHYRRFPYRPSELSRWLDELAALDARYQRLLDR